MQSIQQSTIALKITHRAFPSHGLLVDAVLVILGSFLIGLSAQAVVRLPFTPVPITGQTFAVLLVGFALGWQRGALSLALYLLEGAMGLPVFSSGGFGVTWLLGPTGGYLLGFVPAAGLVGYLAEHGVDRHWYTTLLAFALGQFVIYLVGASWLSVFVGVGSAIQAGVLPFLIGDVIKAVLAALALPLAWKFVR